MIINPLLSGELTFKKDTHQYFLKNGRELLSVSRFIDKFMIPFDPTGIILAMCAKKKGITKEQLKEEWDKTKNDATESGTAIHAELEYYIKNGKLRPSPYKDIVKEFKKIKFTEGYLQSEAVVYDIDAGLAGTIDLIHFVSSRDCHLFDFKSNDVHKLHKCYKKPFLPPLSHLYANNMNKYTLQLSLYTYILENMGIWVKDITLLHIDQQTRKITPYKITYRRADVLKMIKHHKENGGAQRQNREANMGDFDF